MRAVGQGPRAKGDTILKSFNEFELWKERISEIGFVPALNEYLNKLHTQHHRNNLLLESDTEIMQDHERVVCVERGNPMEKCTVYCCCTNSD